MKIEEKAVPTRESPLAEELLLAIFHRVGTGVRLSDDRRLARLLNESANSFGGSFRSLAWDPRYFYSRALTAALQTFDLGGMIIRQNAATKYFSVSAHAAGPFGASYYDALEPSEKAGVDSLARKIQDTFGESRGNREEN